MHLFALEHILVQLQLKLHVGVVDTKLLKFFSHLLLPSSSTYVCTYHRPTFLPTLELSAMSKRTD